MHETEEEVDHLVLIAAAEPDQIRALRAAARDFAGQHGVERPEDVALAVGEALANVALHAYPDHGAGALVHLTAARSDSHVTFVIEDDGRGFAARAESPGLGAGLGIMAAVAEHFLIANRAGGGTLVRLEFGVAAEQAEAPPVAHVAIAAD